MASSHAWRPLRIKAVRVYGTTWRRSKLAFIYSAWPDDTALLKKFNNVV